MIPETAPDILSSRIQKAANQLPDLLRSDLPDNLIQRMGASEPMISARAIDMALARLVSITRANAAYADRGIDRTADGKILPKLNVQYHIIGLTDCVGEKDPETTGRIAVEEMGRLERIGVPDSRLNWLQTEPLNPYALSSALASVYFTQLLRQQREPGYRGQLVILGNSAPRNPDNPSAKGCPFVLAHLDGDILYLGTLNEGGIELQPLRQHVKEIWRTSLGVEQEGTRNGSNPKAVFRSQHLLALFEGLVLGNEGLLVERLDTDLIKCSKVLRTRGPDSFENVKLNTSFSEIQRELNLSFGDTIRVEIGMARVVARLAKSHGDGSPGELLLVPGSSPLSVLDPSQTGADLVINGGRALQHLYDNGLDKKSALSGLVVALKPLRDLVHSC